MDKNIMDELTQKIKFTSTQVFLAKEESRLAKIAKKVGIVFPSHHTALFQTRFAKIEEANNNGHRLSEKAVEDTINNLIGSQANINHSSDEAEDGKGFIVGIILDAWINAEKEIEIIYSFAKNVYKESYSRALELMAEGKLSVSFELTTNVKSAEKLNDGTLMVHEINWDGVGVLLGKNPAYNNAKTYEVLAQTYKERAEAEKELLFASEIIKGFDDILENDSDSFYLSEQDLKNFVADMQKKYNKKRNYKSEQNLQIKEKIVMTEEQKKLVSSIRAELEGFISKEVTDEQLLDEKVVAEIRKIKSEKDAEAKKTTETVSAESTAKTEEQRTSITIYKDDGTIETLQSSDCNYTWVDSEGQSRTENIKSASKRVVIYASEEQYNTFQSKITEADNKIKAVEDKVTSLEAKIVSQEAEIKKFQAEKDAVEAEAKKKKLEEIKSSLKENKYVAEFKDEDYFNQEKVANAILLQERDNLKAENEALKAGTFVPVKAEEKPLDTGHKPEDVSSGGFPVGLMRKSRLKETK